jgi:dolichol-phosphate mannosyltransferase
MTTPRILIALATYNEIGNLPPLVEQVESICPTADILIVDDNSPDGTGRWCDQRARDDPRVTCLHRPGKQGLGSATNAAMRFALEKAYDVFISMDADWSHDPAHLPQLVNATQSADVAIGSRYCPGGAIEGWPIHRRVLSRLMNRLSRAMLRLPPRDTSGAFRAYQTGALRKIDLARVRSAGYGYLEEILWHLHRAGASFAEVPITFHERKAGRSKINAAEAVGKLGTLIRLIATKP